MPLGRTEVKSIADYRVLHSISIRNKGIISCALWTHAALVLLVLTLASPALLPAADPPPASPASVAGPTPEEMLRFLHVPDGFTIELVAGPPLVERPIMASFDDRGRLFVDRLLRRQPPRPRAGQGSAAPGDRPRGHRRRRPLRPEPRLRRPDRLPPGPALARRGGLRRLAPQPLEAGRHDGHRRLRQADGADHRFPPHRRLGRRPRRLPRTGRANLRLLRAVPAPPQGRQRQADRARRAAAVAGPVQAGRH